MSRLGKRIIGLFDSFKGKRDTGGRRRTSRSFPVSGDDGLLLPGQVQNLIAYLDRYTTEIAYFEDLGDPMLPESAFFVPNLLQEFNLDPMLAMIHGDGVSHAWVNVAHLREALRRFPRPVADYRALFTLLTDAGFHVKKIGYISFRSAIRT